MVSSDIIVYGLTDVRRFSDGVKTMLEGFEEFIEESNRAHEEFLLTAALARLQEFQDEFSSLRSEYDILGRDLLISSATTDRIINDKYHAPFNETINIVSRDQDRVRAAISALGE